jgi:hypothetical protein
MDERAAAVQRKPLLRKVEWLARDVAAIERGTVDATEMASARGI